MENPQNLLVAVAVNEEGEYPDPSQEALTQALALAESIGAKVTLLCSIGEEAAQSDAVLEGQDRATIVSAKLAETIKDATERGITAHSLVKPGRPWLEIIQAVLEHDFDLVIVGSRKQNLAKRMLFGTTATKLLRKCPCPVWVTRPRDPDDDGIPTVLAADDLGPVGEKILFAAVTAAQLMQARLLVVHAIRFPLLGSMHRTEVPSDEIKAYKEQVRSQAESAIHDRLAMTDYRTIQEGTQILIKSGAADVVIENAVSEYDADLLVMGTLGRGGIPGLLIGNTAERLLPQLKCSVLALKPDEFKCPIS